MSWLNLNQSLSSLKGQITNFASEVLSEGPVQDSGDDPPRSESPANLLEEKCRKQELEIADLKRLTSELEATLQSERLSRRNGVKEEESSWYWDPPAQTNSADHNEHYKQQIRALQQEISSLNNRQAIDTRPDAEEELTRLREENRNLAGNLEDLDNQHQLAMERLLTLKKELQKNFEVLKQEHEDLKKSNDEYSIEIQSLLTKVGERDLEIGELKTAKADYETLHHKYMNLEKVHSLLRENAEKFQEENQELHEEIFKLQEQVTKLEHEIEISAKHSELSNMVPRESYDELLKELNETKGRRESTPVHLDEINIDDNAKSVIETLKRDIIELKHKLSQKESQDHSDHRLIKTDKIMQLYNKYIKFDLPVDYIGEIPSSDDNIILQKLEIIFKAISSFKKDIDSLEHKLSEKNHNINHLQTQIDDLTTENDFLTTDVQQFEGELNEMKKNNDFLISEITALKNTSKLEPIIETHEDNLVKLESELADSNRINKTFESEIKRIEKELAEVKSEKTVLQDSLIDLRTKYTSMLNELETCKTQTKAIEELDVTATSDHNEKLKNASDEIDNLKKRLSTANAKNEQLSIDIHIIENDKVILTKEVDDLKQLLEEKKTTHKDLETMKIALEQQLQDLEYKLDEIIKEKKEIDNHNSTLQQKVNLLETKNFSNSDNSSTNSELQKISTENANLSEKLNEVSKENSTLMETIEKLTIEIANWRKSHQDVVTENNSLRNSTNNEFENVTALQQIIDGLKAKVIDQDILNNEIMKLKNENKQVVERKLLVEAELISTDNKIVHLEQEFDKLISDLNEKDGIIDALNDTVKKNNVKLVEFNENVTDLQSSVEIKNKEIQKLSQSLKEVSEKLNEITVNSDRSFEELNRLHIEKEEMSKQIFTFNEDLSSKNVEISKLTNRLEELNETCSDYESTIDRKDKEIKELNQSIVELVDKTKTNDIATDHNDEYVKLVQEKELLEKEIEELKYNHSIIEQQFTENKINSEQLERTCLEYKTVVDNATREKTELINLINLKHNESIQYHNEIQRLNHMFLDQTTEFKRVMEEKDRLLHNQSECCPNCEVVRITLKEKDEIIMALNEKASDNDRVKAELVNASDIIRNLTERCDSLDRSLAIQLEAVKKLTAENVQLSEQEQNSTRELERLRHHLVELEENYTLELMTSEQKLTECQTRLYQVEDRAKQTSTVYTSNSIRANQEVETLRNQIRLLEKQREEGQARLSEAEDGRSRSEAALTNLQVVLEQFQLDKERDIHSATEKIKNKMEDLRRQNGGLQSEIARLNAKLEESLAGLQAATRLGDQVETKTAQINDLKEQVRALQSAVAAAEERYSDTVSNQQDKVDKNLVKNLLINYVMTAAQNNLNKTQVLRILSTVLDFNQQECERLGLSRPATAADSLAAEFVRFLQEESKPRAALPNMMGIAQASSRSTTPVSRRSSTLGPQPNFDIGHKRNPSNGSNNLLFQNIDNIETSSQHSVESEREPRVVGLDTGVNQTRNSEGAILKYVLKDM